MLLATVAFAAAGMLLTGSTVAEGPDQLPVRVVVVVSQDAAPFREALAGLRRRLVAGGVTITVVDMLNDPQAAEAMSRTIEDVRPVVVVSLGSLAARSAIARAPHVPLVAGMVLEPEELAGAANATGVYLQFPVAVELEWLTRLLPSARRVGVVYHSAATHQRMLEARRLAPGLGLTLHAFRVDGPAQIPDALASIAERSDVLWGHTDQIVYNPQTAKPLLVFSFKHLIPLMGPAPPWVRAGGLLALERDYGDIGLQCAELVERILAGAAARSLPPMPPRRVQYVVNARTGDQLRLNLPGGLLRDAVEVVR